MPEARDLPGWNKGRTIQIVNTSQVEPDPFVKPEDPGRAQRLAGGTDVAAKRLVEGDYYRIAVTTYAKGVRLKFHSHSEDQLLVVVSGNGVVATEEEERIVLVGDFIHTPAGVMHSHGAAKDSEASYIFVNPQGPHEMAWLDRWVQ